jgi:NAD-dependent dihydropyrimidine dehydrogenase PreA subunit
MKIMIHKYLKNVTTLSFAPEKCTGCETCTQVCPHGVFSMDEGKAKIIEKDLCMECGACALNCLAKAIDVNAGVGCATAIIMSWFTGKEPTCDCSDSDCC